jgi:hypothetical protein
MPACAGHQVIGHWQYQRRRWPGQARPSKMQTRFAVYTRIGIST